MINRPSMKKIYNVYVAQIILGKYSNRFIPKYFGIYVYSLDNTF